MIKKKECRFHTSIELFSFPKLFFQLAILTIALFSLTTFASEVGNIPGSFEVSPSGAATYTIPIEVPPGVNNLQPDLALVYNSQSGNGLLGQGWGLSGLSSISRCPKTLEQDGEIHGVDFTNEDRLCLDGQRLILVNGDNANDNSYWSSTAEFRTEIETFSKVMRNGQGFLVKTKSGRIAEYGNTADSAQNVHIITTGAQPILTWAVNEISDQSGNSIYYEYDEDVFNGDQKLSRIHFSGNAAALVNFFYDNRPDKLNGYISGAKYNTSERLISIETNLGDQNFQVYSLGYDESEQAGRSYINSIKQCSALDNKCKSPLNFNTGQKTSGWSENATGYKLPHNIYNSDGQSAAQFADVNGDGLQDWVLAAQMGGTSYRYTYINTGKTWVRDVTYDLPNNIYNHDKNGNQQGQLIDVNSDGLVDWVIAYQGTQSYRSTYINNSFSDCVTRSCKWVVDTDYKLPHNIYNSTGKQQGEFVDVDGDGFQDWVLAYQGSQSFRETWINNSSRSYVNGYVTGLGKITNINYSNLSDSSIYNKEDYPQYPVMNYQGALQVVSIVSTDNGAGGQNVTAYKYGGQKYHQRGRGSLGFRWMETTDQQTGIKSKTEYYQEYPFVGAVKHTETRAANNQLLKTIDKTYAYNGFTCARYPVAGWSIPSCGGQSPGIVYPYAKEVITAERELNGELIKTVTNKNTFDQYGNPTQIESETVGQGLSGNTETFTAVTKNTYSSNFYNLWPPTRLTRAEVTKYLPDYVSVRNGSCYGNDCTKRTSAFSYDATTGRMTREVMEPDIPALRLQTDHTYDGFGNRVSSTVTGGSGATAIVSRTSSTNYDSQGQFPTSTTNALGHTESKVWDARFGVPLSLTGPNQIKTSWTYDGFGRKTKETRADGTTSTIVREWCNGVNGEVGNINCPAGGVSAITTHTTGAATNTVYADKLGRTIREETQGFDGTPIYVDTIYNSLGQVYKKSRPYFSGDAVYYHTFTYDAVGRVSTETKPDGSYTTTSYAGLTTTVTNDKNQTTSKVNNAIGELVQVTDANYNTINYQYDPQGNLIHTQDSEGNVISTTYNIRGFKTSMNDPDLGAWTYDYNALGELIKQTDAKGIAVTTSYDKLGRIKQRVEPEGTSTWSYDTAAKGKGKLTSIQSAEGISNAFTYDSFGRPYKVSTVIDGTTYNVLKTYDSAGRLKTLTYPSSPSYVNGLSVTHIYNAQGYLTNVKNASTSANFWQADAMDASGQLTLMTYGNGVVTNQWYDFQTGRLTNIISDSGASSIQDYGFSYDSIGNLTQRNDYKRGVSEAFNYDSLNRLTSSSVSGNNSPSSKTYTYDNLGNITSKTNIGTYLYGAGSAGPHAVTSVNKGGAVRSFTYDANGNLKTGYNLTTGLLRTLNWTSYNKPLSISMGSASNTFKYGADRARFKQTSVVNGQSTTRIYVGSLYEKETKGNKTSHLHYINAGGKTIAIYKSIVDNGVKSSATHYLHRDHLGSISEITNDAGQLIESLSYDAFGKRRNVDWSDAAGQINAQTTKRSFTGHEYLEDVGIIHMNGRVYDPDLGRFMSADPLITLSASTQGFNRYSYTDNNPLSRLDPAGFSWFSKEAKRFFGRVTKEVNRFYSRVSNELSRFETRFRHEIRRPGSLLGTAIQLVSTWYCGGAPQCAAAAAGFVTAAQGGEAEDVLSSAAMAYASSKFNGYLSDNYKEIYASAVSGAVNGVIQLRSGEGLTLGFIGGLIPFDLGMTSFYNDIGWANALISVARDGIRGGILDGSDGARNSIRAGIFNNAVGHVYGLIKSGGVLPTFSDSVWEYKVSNMPRAVAMGNTVTYDKSPNVFNYNKVMPHERQHVNIQSALNASYFSLHIFSQANYLYGSGYAFMEQAPFMTLSGGY